MSSVDARVIYQWSRCEEIAASLGMKVSTTSEMLVAQGKGGPGDPKNYYVSETVQTLLGYLEGFSHAREAAIARASKGE